MNAVDLDAIQARADAATEGPWFREYSDVVTAHPDPRDVAEGYEDARNSRVVRGAPNLPKKDRQGIADAAFIAAARTDVPALLARVRSQQAALDKVEIALDAMDAGVVIRSGDPRSKSHAATVIRAAIRAALTATEATA